MTTGKPTPDQVAAIVAALQQGTAIICYAKCWPCQFGQHDGGAHTWMDEDDIRHAGLTVPATSDGWAALAADKPCGCDCNGRTA